MTPDLLAKVMPFCGVSAARTFAGPLTVAMEQWSINTPVRQAAFLANVAAETASLSLLKEVGTGAGYVGILGNRTLAEAELYVGRGCLQITGRDNYAACGQALNLPLLTNPDRLLDPEYAAQSAGWFWQSHGLNALADQDPNKFITICTRINGGYNGADERVACWLYARRAFGCNP